MAFEKVSGNPHVFPTPSSINGECCSSQPMHDIFLSPHPPPPLSGSDHTTLTFLSPGSYGSSPWTGSPVRARMSMQWNISVRGCVEFYATNLIPFLFRFIQLLRVNPVTPRPTPFPMEFACFFTTSFSLPFPPPPSNDLLQPFEADFVQRLFKHKWRTERPALSRRAILPTSPSFSRSPLFTCWPPPHYIYTFPLSQFLFLSPDFEIKITSLISLLLALVLILPFLFNLLCHLHFILLTRFLLTFPSLRPPLFLFPLMFLLPKWFHWTFPPLMTPVRLRSELWWNRFFLGNMAQG